LPMITSVTPTEPYGFPAWLRLTHYVNLLLLVLLVRSGLQILADHPRLYWNVHCTPGTEWLGFTPVLVPQDRGGQPFRWQAPSKGFNATYDFFRFDQRRSIVDSSSAQATGFGRTPSKPAASHCWRCLSSA
jgi:hypothetical protein